VTVGESALKSGTMFCLCLTCDSVSPRETFELSTNRRDSTGLYDAVSGVVILGYQHPVDKDIHSAARL
jgi:hypothetical protein